MSCIRYGEDLCTPVNYYNFDNLENCQDVVCNDYCVCTDTYESRINYILDRPDGSINCSIRYGERFCAPEVAQNTLVTWEDVADFFRGAWCLMACEGYQDFDYNEVSNECNCIGDFYPIAHGR